MTPLIPRATPLEAALERATAARLALPAQILTTTNDPWTCPADQLGLLAWSLSLELWDDRWPELKKRHVCAGAFRLHRLKTTLAGIRAHVALVDAEVRGAVRPPACAFWRSAITDAAREAQLAALPQIRLYPFAHQATARRRWFLSSRAARRSYHGHAWLRASRGAEMLGTRATYWQGGTERPIDVVEEAGEIRAFLPAARPNGTWYGHGAASGFLRLSRGAASVVAFRPDPARAAFALSRGADAVSIAPTRVFARRIAPRHRSFVGRRLRFLQSTAAPLLVYDRYSIADPSVGIVRRRTRSWHGHMRFGIRPFTAELRVAVPMHRPRARTGAWAGSGFRASASLRPLSRALEAIRLSKALRDTVLVDTTTTREVRFGDGLAFGSFAFGEIRKVA